MKILVISDIHQRIYDVQKILDKEKNHVDHIVFLGDYFDSFPEYQQASFLNTCEWVYEKYIELGNKATFLIGNHDLSYFEEVKSKKQYANHSNKGKKKFECSGYSRNKGQYAKKVFRDEKVKFWDDIKLFYSDDYFLYSHAGFSRRLFKPNWSFEENLKWFDRCWEKFKVQMNKGIYMDDEIRWIIDIGYRMGDDCIGMAGPLWNDWRHEFEPIDGINQIVGHTYHDVPQNKNNNFCFDCISRYYAIINDGLIEIKNNFS